MMPRLLTTGESASEKDVAAELSRHIMSATCPKLWLLAGDQPLVVETDIFAWTSVEIEMYCHEKGLT